VVEHNDPRSGSETNQSLLSNNIILLVVVVTIVVIIYISIPPYSCKFRGGNSHRLQDTVKPCFLSKKLINKAGFQTWTTDQYD